MDVLFLTQGPIEDATARFRVYQYIKPLAALGVASIISPAISSEHYGLAFRRSTVDRIELLTRTVGSRLVDLTRLHRFDVVFVEREVVPRLFPVFELLVHQIGIPLVFDFDDNIFANPLTSQDSLYRVATKLLMDAAAARRIVAVSDVVIAGSKYLAEIAGKINPTVFHIPTCVDMDRYPTKDHVDVDAPTIGWMGSPSTTRYMNTVAKSLLELSNIRRFRLLLVGAEPASLPALRDLPWVEFRPWRLDSEVSDLLEFDIGIMPLADDEWSRGKCAFKAIQYMAAGVPPVCSAIGAVPEVVTDARTGLTYDDEDSFRASILALLDSHTFRRQLGSAARREAQERFSVKAATPHLYRAIRSAAQ